MRVEDRAIKEYGLERCQKKIVAGGGFDPSWVGGWGGGGNFKKEGLDKNRISLKVTSSKNYNF